MKKAFTLIELLVVITIIGIIATITMGTYSLYIHKAKVLKAQTDMKLITDTIIIARQESNQYLWGITNNGCSDCSCRDANYAWGLGPLNKLPDPDNDICFIVWRESLAKIAEAANTSLSDIDLDPWGNPYLLDENEGEGGACINDTLMSVGPDGERREWFHNEDNIEWEIPLHSNCTP